MLNNRLIVIAGPTAVGKTELAIRVAQYFETEIVSADSRQFYKEMAVGTAKPNPEELNQVKHHFINSHSIKEEFSAGEYELQALAALHNIFSNHNVAILTGGSGLFIKAVTEGFDNLPKARDTVRQELNKTFEEKGLIPLQQQLKELDLDYYSQVDLNNPQRIIRALEVCISSGKPFSSFHTQLIRERPFKIIKIGLNLNREELYSRINNRVDKMILDGLLDEAKSLSPFRHLNALNTVGYSELYDFLDNKISFKEAVDKIKQNTRRFAKRQLTWLRKDTEIKWFEPSQLSDIIKYIEERTESN